MGIKWEQWALSFFIALVCLLLAKDYAGTSTAQWTFVWMSGFMTCIGLSQLYCWDGGYEILFKKKGKTKKVK